MRHCDVIRVVCAALVGCAWSASGRGIPVHRGYTRSILLYDESGMRTANDGEAPDLVALRLLRDTQAQEGLMGRETLMEMTFDRGRSAFGLAPRGAGAPVPSLRDDDNRRRRPEESGRNWLVQSLPLPALGQGSSNAALSAMSAGSTDSSWGWLADEVNPPAAWGASEYSPEENMLRTNAEGALRDEAANPFAAERAGRRTDEAAGPATAASFPVRSEAGTRPPDRVADRTVESARERSLTAERPAQGPPAARAPDRAMADMSQTRQMLSEITAAAKPDLATWRGAEMSGSAPGGQAVERMSAGRVVEPPRAPGESAWSGLGGRSGVPAERTPATFGAAPRATWQGGWDAQPIRGTTLTRLDQSSDPIPATVVPAVTRGMPRGVSSGGTKPAWY